MRWCEMIEDHKHKTSVTFDDMTLLERTDYIRYLWRRLAVVVKVRGLIFKIEDEQIDRKRRLFGLDPSIKQYLEGDKPHDGLENKLEI